MLKQNILLLLGVLIFIFSTINLIVTLTFLQSKNMTQFAVQPQEDRMLYAEDDKAQDYLSRFDGIYKKIPSADPETFTCDFANNEYREWCADYKSVYFLGNFVNIDRETFEIIIPGYEKDCGFASYVKDAWAVYYDGKYIAGADPKTFQVIGVGLSKDKNAVYDRTERISSSPDTFDFQKKMEELCPVG